MAEPVASEELKPTPKRRGRPPKQAQLDLGTLSDEAKSYIRATRKAAKEQREQWRGFIAVPPGTLIEHILKEFQKHTSIPLEIPFFTIMHYLSGYLVSKRVKSVFMGKEIEADFWTIVLGTSGAGKTWTQNTIKQAIGKEVPELNISASSSARFLEEMEAMPQALWVRDEFYQLLKLIEQDGGPLSEVKGFLLQAYDHADLERSTKKDHIHVKEPVLSILGFNALKPFIDGMNLESLVDGFSQRFGYVLSKPDPERPWQKYPVWQVDSTAWNGMWNQLVANIQQQYTVSPEAEAAFFRCFSDSISTGDVDESFYRRILWRAHKFALIYHILRGQAANAVIDAEDYGWAARVISMQLSDASEVLDLCGGSDLKKMLEQCESSVQRLNAEGKPITARNIIRSCSLIKNAASAKLVCDMLGIPLN